MDIPHKVTRLITNQKGRQWRAKECAAADGSWVLEERVKGDYEYRGLLDLFTGAYFCGQTEPSYFETEPESLEPEAMVRYVATVL